MAGFFGVPTNEVVLTSVFMALEGAFAYSAFLPSIMTIGTFVDSPEKVRMIREGEAVGTLFLGGLSLTVAFIMKSAWPAIFGMGAGLLAILVYEYALSHSPQNPPTILDGVLPEPEPDNHHTNGYVVSNLYRM